MAENEKPTKGRGGNSNFPNAKFTPKNDKDKELVGKLLSETLVAYKQAPVKNDDELTERLEEYFQYCGKNGITPTVEEMCLYTGYTSAALWDWEHGRRKGFSPKTAGIIKKAKEFLKTFDAKLVIAGKLNFLAYCFRAKNYYGMVDKVEHEVVTQTPTLAETVNRAEIERMLLDDGLETTAKDVDF